MAMVNMFDLLGDDDTNDDPTQIAVQQQKIAAKKAAPTPAKMQSKPMPPSQAAVREAKSNIAAPRGGGSGRDGLGRGGGRGGRGGQGRDFVNGSANGVAGSFGGGGGGGEEGDARRHLDRERGPYNGLRQPFRGGRHGGYGNEDAGGHSEHHHRNFERWSGTGHGYEVKREGAGHGNWGTATDDAFVQEKVHNVNVDEKVASYEKPPEQEDRPSIEVGKENKEEQVNDAEEKEKEDKEMTLEEYEKVREEKRKALLAMKTEERKVEIDNELKNMQQISMKKGNDEFFIKLGSDKEKKKENADKDERVKKSLSIAEFLKPAKGERYYNPGGRGRGRGRGDRGDRSSFQGGYGGGGGTTTHYAPSIEDPRQFPTLGGK